MRKPTLKKIESLRLALADIFEGELDKQRDLDAFEFCTKRLLAEDAAESIACHLRFMLEQKKKTQAQS